MARSAPRKVQMARPHLCMRKCQKRPTIVAEETYYACHTGRASLGEVMVFFVIEIVGEIVPVLDADLEDLVIVHLGDMGEVLETLNESAGELLSLKDRQMCLEDCCQK
jgi:hypothetical protein